MNYNPFYTVVQFNCNYESLEKPTREGIGLAIHSYSDHWNFECNIEQHD